MKLYAKVKKFSETSPELYNAFKGYFEDTRREQKAKGTGFKTFSKDDQETVINKLFSEELVKRSGMTVDQFDGSYARYAKSTVVKDFADAIIDYMVDMILPETLIGSIGILADIKFAGLGDVLKFDIKNNGLFKISKAGRRQRSVPAQKMGDTSVTIDTENHEVTVYLSLFDVLTGRQSIAEYIMKVVKTIETEMLYEIYDAFISATNDSNIPSALKETAFDEKKLISLCQKVTAWNQGKKAIILGTSVALKSVLPTASGTRILLGDEYNTIGYMHTFNNYDVIEMVQVADYTSENYGLKLDDGKIFVLSPASDKVIKVGVEGEALSNTSGTFDHANLVQEGTINKAWGVKCVTNSIVGRMDV